MASASSSTSTPNDQLGNAFEEVVPPSSSSTFTDLPWDVFINHRGIDVKQTLATTIYNTLDRLGLRVFLDVEALEGGDVIPTQIQHAMQNALLHIAIFSTNYAQSPWCLAELAFMLKTGTRIIPVFYHVDPSDLRWVGKGIYASAFSQHEEKGRYTREKLEEWKRALQDVSFHSGYMIDNINDEGRVLKTMVNSILKAMKKVPLEVAIHPVGLDDAVSDFEITVESARIEHNVQIVGIVGMGGSGKTTLAKELYNRKCSSFYSSSFVFEVRDAAARNTLHDKQTKLLVDIGGKDFRFDNVEEGKGFLVSRLRSMHLLIVLDDVDHVNQLEALLPAKHSLASGSLIIVTSRDSDVLTKWQISCIYKMKGLSHSHAKQLFCWHAFLQDHPLYGFEDLVDKFLNACDGLPLSLKVFGGQVYSKTLNYWKSQLHKICRILPEDIKGRLKISYDALDEEEKEMFMDVACFFIREKSSLAIEVWDGCGWSGLHSWETLVNKCLVDLDKDNRITMHDHLRDLGRDLANKDSPSRVWLPQQMIDIQKQARERLHIRGINAAQFKLSRQQPYEKLTELIARWFRRPPPSSLGLKLLTTRDEKLSKEFATTSEDLVWLRWLAIQNKKLPSWLSLEKLRVLELEKASNLQELWADVYAPLQLRELSITSGINFHSFPKSIGYLSHLRKMIAINCVIMKSLPEEFCGLQCLEHLELKNCRKLSSLPTSFGDLTNLRHIDFSGCMDLEMLPVSFKQLIHLQHLNLTDCWELSLRLDMMENMTKLEYLRFSRCEELKELPHGLTNQASLRELYVNSTSLRVLPTNISQLGKLQVLEIGSPFMESLPSSLANLCSLTRLKIDGCTKLESLGSVGHLNMLEDLLIRNSGVNSLPKDFAQLTHLRCLTVYKSPLSELGSSSLCKFKEIHIENTQVPWISISEDCCPSLEILVLGRNDHLTDIETLPTSVKQIEVRESKMLKKIRGISGLVNLQTLSISECPELEELPSFADLSSIQEITIDGCDKLEKMDGLEHSKSLEMLTAKTSWKSQGIQSLEHAKGLKSVKLVAENRSALQPCIQIINKWPLEMVIGGRAVSDVESVIDSLSFNPSLTVVQSLKRDEEEFHPLKKTEDMWTVECGKRHSSDAAIVCFLVNSCNDVSYCKLSEAQETDLTVLNINLRTGKWVFVCLFREGCRIMNRATVIVKASSNGEVEKGMLVVGEEGKVLEAFHHFWQLFMS